MPRPIKKFVPKCIHILVRTNGVTVCSKCKIKSISYLSQ